MDTISIRPRIDVHIEGNPNGNDFSQVHNKVLKPNDINGVNTLTQEMIDECGADTIFTIKHDYTLDGSITFPENCVLDFEGGSFTGGIIVGNNTKIYNPYKSDIFKGTSKQGTFIELSATDWENISNKPNFATVATSGSYNDLTDKPSIPSGQQQADWNQSNTSAVDYIKNKPTKLSDFTDDSNYINGAEYDSNLKRINLKHGNTIVAWIDASPFIIDGMVSSVAIENGKLVVKFNTDAGKQDIEIPLTDIFNPDNYYNKDQVDTKLSGKADASSLASVATSGNYNDLSNKPTIPTVPTNVSAFNNDAGYLTQHQDISGKQDKLVSGTNIKTINNQSLLGSGNISIGGGGGGFSPTLNDPQNGDMLIYDSMGAWVNAPLENLISGFGFIKSLSLNNLTNVTITDVAEGNIIVYDGSKWVNTSWPLTTYATKTWVEEKGYITSSGSCARAGEAAHADEANSAANAAKLESHPASDFLMPKFNTTSISNNSVLVYSSMVGGWTNYSDTNFIANLGLATQTWVRQQNYFKPTLSNLANGDVLVYDSVGAWVNTPISSFLSGYATQSWVNQQGFSKFNPTVSNPQNRDIVVYESGGAGWLNASLDTLLSGYATENWVNNKGYITSSALNDYLTKSGGTLTGNLTISNGYPSFELYRTDTGMAAGIYYGNHGMEFDEEHYSMFHFAGDCYAETFNQTSDKTLKNKVADVELTAEQIAEAPSIKFTWKDENKSQEVNVGTTAQYWQEILPEVVGKDRNDKLTLNYSALATVSVISLAKEVVELREKVSTLEERLEKLEKLMINN